MLNICLEIVSERKLKTLDQRPQCLLQASFTPSIVYLLTLSDRSGYDQTKTILCTAGINAYPVFMATHIISVDSNIVRT